MSLTVVVTPLVKLGDAAGHFIGREPCTARRRHDHWHALRRPTRLSCWPLLILITGTLAALRTPVDIFPDIRIPVIGVAWQYTASRPMKMAGRITTLYERVLTTTVNDIEHIEGNSYKRFGIVKIYFQPNVDIPHAMPQVTAISQTVLKQLPPAPRRRSFSTTTPPYPSSSWHSRARACRSRTSAIWDQRGPHTPVSLCPARRFPIPSAARRAKCRSIWMPTPCRRAASAARRRQRARRHRI